MNDNETNKKKSSTIMYHIDYSHVKQEFGNKLLELRKERKLSQEEVSKALGVSRVALGYYERGERTADIEFLLKAADLYRVSPNYLLGKGPKNINNDGLSLFEYFSGKSIDFLMADNKRFQFLDAVLSHDDIEKAADLIYMTHYKPLINKYETRFNTFLLTQILYSIICDVSEEVYEFKNMTDDEKHEVIKAIEEYRSQRAAQQKAILYPPAFDTTDMLPNHSCDIPEEHKQEFSDWWSYIEKTDEQINQIYDKIVALLNK